ncbi:50S ribosomal protein L5 [Candidatus Saccharibacteria bacterium]|nr:50S ribosomal protein L5 [Candidatus Saccharibacteria bacterium]
MAKQDTNTKTAYGPRLKTDYYERIRPELRRKLELKNLHQVPKLEKIVVNAGLGRTKDDKKVFETAANTLAKISGQNPKVTTARISVASFKLRTGQEIGLMSTLRGDRMYEFLDRLINLVMPRLRDFRGAPLKAFDRSGNYSIGFREQSIFPELSFEETSPPHGLQATLVFESAGPEHSRALLEEFGFKFEKSAQAEAEEES